MKKPSQIFGEEQFLKRIVHGKGLGRQIGFPTLNLSPAILPIPFGVYCCRVFFLQTKKTFYGVMHYGVRQTLYEKTPVLEVHLLNFKREVYGEEVQIALGPKLRAIKKFESLADLKVQIEKDVVLAEQMLKGKF